ncbi:hypothetical protein RB201_04255 [Streptomyces sp. S1A(2023)]
MTDTPMTPDHNRLVCTQEAAHAAGLDVAPSPEELRAVSESIVSLWGDRWAEPDDEVGSIADSGAQLARVMPLVLDEVDRLRKALSEAADQVAELEDGLGQASAETAALKQRIHEACMARAWINEDGKKFVFAEDLKEPLLGKAPLRGRALLDAKTAEEATTTHWKRLGIDPAAGEAVAAELEAAGSRLAATELLVEEARDKCNHSVDTDLLLDALGLES